MEGQIECTNRWMMDLVEAQHEILGPDFPQIPTYVKRNEANRRPRYSYPFEPFRIFGTVTSHRDASVESPGKRNERGVRFNSFR